MERTKKRKKKEQEKEKEYNIRGRENCQMGSR